MGNYMETGTVMEIGKYIDLPDATERFMKNDSMFKKFLFRFPGENDFEELFRLIEEDKKEEAFPVAHTMKGVAANLALQFVYQAICPVSDLLKKGVQPEEEAVEMLKRAYEETILAIAQIQREDVPLLG